MAHAYQSPAFILEHLAAAAGVAAITTANATAAGQGVARLIDYRTAAPLLFSGSAADHDIEVDLTTTTVCQSLYIPAGHNLGTTTVEVFSGASSPAAVSEGTKAATAGAAFQFDWVNGTGARFWRVAFNASGTWSIPELVLGTETRTLVRGPDTGWDVVARAPVNVAEFPSFESTILLAPPRDAWSLRFVRMGDAADLATFDALRALGRARPVAFLPPDSHYGWTWVRVATDFDFSQGFPEPLSALRYTAALELVEQL